jgi:putative ABC transport system ATP-binding protein
VNPAVEVHGLTKAYGRGATQVTALRGVELEVPAGSLAMIVGPSGCGKTTLISVVAGILDPSAGSCRVLGAEPAAMADLDRTAWRARNVGFVFQQFNLLPTLTALENAILPGTLDRLDRDECVARGRTLLGELGLSERIDHRPEALSGGEQQRVAIARSLFFDPPILLADEPTGNLDSRTSERLWNLLGSIAASRRMLVLLVTHEPAAAAHCRVVHVMRDGLLAGSIDVASLDSSHRPVNVASELALRAAELGRAQG